MKIYTVDDVVVDGWILYDIDPTAFNVLSDLLGMATRALVGISLGLLYPLLLSWYLQRQRRHDTTTAAAGITTNAAAGIPLATIDANNGGILSTLRLAQVTKGSFPVMFLLCALLVAESSHPIADAGFDFITIKQPGSDEAILNLREDWRNHDRPLETTGEGFLYQGKEGKASLGLEYDGLNPDRIMPIKIHLLSIRRKSC